MFASLRLYRLNPIFESDFTKLWNQITVELKKDAYIEKAILHKESKISYISYMQWHTKDDFESLSRDTNSKYAVLINKLKECCNSVHVLHRMEVLEENAF